MTNQSITNQSLNQSINQSMNQSINQSINQIIATYESWDTPAWRQTNKSINESINQITATYESWYTPAWRQTKVHKEEQTHVLLIFIPNFNAKFVTHIGMHVWYQNHLLCNTFWLKKWIIQVYLHAFAWKSDQKCNNILYTCICVSETSSQ